MPRALARNIGPDTLISHAQFLKLCENRSLLFQASRFAVICDGATGNSNTHAPHRYKQRPSQL